MSRETPGAAPEDYPEPLPGVLGVSKPTVTSALKTLADGEHVDHQNYGYVQLTGEGPQGGEERRSAAPAPHAVLPGRPGHRSQAGGGGRLQWATLHLREHAVTRIVWSGANGRANPSTHQRVVPSDRSLRASSLKPFLRSTRGTCSESHPRQSAAIRVVRRPSPSRVPA